MPAASQSDTANNAIKSYESQLGDEGRLELYYFLKNVCPEIAKVLDQITFFLIEFCFEYRFPLIASRETKEARKSSAKNDVTGSLLVMVRRNRHHSLDSKPEAIVKIPESH